MWTSGGRLTLVIAMRMSCLPALILGSVFPLAGQVTATMDRLPDGSTGVRIRNEGAVDVTAFGIRVKYLTGNSAVNDPLIVYVDPAIDAIPPVNTYARRIAASPLGPNQEITVELAHMLPFPRGREGLSFERPQVAGVLADGSSTGDAGLIARLLLRRSNMLLAVETTLEILSKAGRQNLERDQIIGQFESITDAMDRWYIPSEQQVGLRVYRAAIGKLKDLPDGAIGTAFPPGGFVARETAMLTEQRAALLESLPAVMIAR